VSGGKSTTKEVNRFREAERRWCLGLVSCWRTVKMKGEGGKMKACRGGVWVWRVIASKVSQLIGTATNASQSTMDEQNEHIPDLFVCCSVLLSSSIQVQGKFGKMGGVLGGERRGISGTQPRAAVSGVVGQRKTSRGEVLIRE
jgi:hypothetical protein